MKNIKKITAIILVCTLTLSAILPVFAATPSAGKVQAQKVSDELLELMNVSYSDLSKGSFLDDGTTYSCIIWINDIDKEVAVKAGIDAAEKTRDTYRASAKYEYPYTLEEANGVKYVDVQFDENENDEYVQTYIEAERAASAELYESQNSDFVAENFKIRDTEVNYVSSYTPCVFADLTKSRIAELMNAEDVNRIGYWDDSCGEDASSIDPTVFDNAELVTLNSHIIAIAANVAKAQYNVSGAGIKIGQYEKGCPDNDNVTKRPGYTDERNHATNVYTIMNKVAPNATYYASSQGTSNYGDNLKAGIEWLISQGVNIINLSYGWGQSNLLNIYDEMVYWIDHIAYNHNVHVVASAGNLGAAGVASPAMAYNIVTIGNVIKEGTSYVRATDPDYPSSYYNNYPSRLLKLTYKPDVVAPGCYAEENQSGTSYSAPLVTGTIALMCQYKSALKTKPRTVKAILAASTGENTGRYITKDHGNFKQYGAGVINAMNAFNILDYNTYASSYVGSGTVERTYNMTVNNTRSNRVALAYENIASLSGTHASANITTQNLISEIKMEIISPSNQVVASCDVLGANLKVLEFTPQSTGTYTIKVTMTQSNTSNFSTYIGVAWQ